MMPVWPDFDTIARSMNTRGNLYAKMSDDPLCGIVITRDMWDRAVAYANWQREQNAGMQTHLQTGDKS